MFYNLYSRSYVHTRTHTHTHTHTHAYPLFKTEKTDVMERITTCISEVSNSNAGLLTEYVDWRFLCFLSICNQMQ
jgi:hypothetical protein